MLNIRINSTQLIGTKTIPQKSSNNLGKSFKAISADSKFAKGIIKDYSDLNFPTINKTLIVGNEKQIILEGFDFKHPDGHEGFSLYKELTDAAHQVYGHDMDQHEKKIIGSNF